MKTWQMIKELTENPTKRFANKGDENAYVVVERNVIVWRGEDQKGQMMTVDIDVEWEEVKQPVSFMEAVASGKRIKLEHEDDGEEYVTLDYFLASIARHFVQGELRDLLLRGTFYIES